MRFHFQDNDDKSNLKQNSNLDLRPILFQIIQYDEFHYLEHNLTSISELKIFLQCQNEDYCTWINIEGIHRNDILDELSLDFNLHKLIKEDICTINERMKLDLLDNGSSIYLLQTLKLIYHIKHDMLSFKILCKPLREIIIKLQKAQDRISMITRCVHSRRQYRRKKRPKRILLSGNYFFNPNSDLYSIKKSTSLFNEYIFIYFKNLNDQIIQLQDRIETYCDLLSSLTSFYMLINNEEMNRIMRFLTLVSVTFIPMMFLIGLFSMNYQNTPPLLWYHGYFTILVVLGIFAISMICLFKWKNLL